MYYFLLSRFCFSFSIQSIIHSTSFSSFFISISSDTNGFIVICLFLLIFDLFHESSFYFLFSSLSTLLLQQHSSVKFFYSLLSTFLALILQSDNYKVWFWLRIPFNFSSVLRISVMIYSCSFCFFRLFWYKFFNRWSCFLKLELLVWS